MPALHIDTTNTTPPHDPSQTSTSWRASARPSAENSPDRPPLSPLTPVRTLSRAEEPGGSLDMASDTATAPPALPASMAPTQPQGQPSLPTPFVAPQTVTTTAAPPLVPLSAPPDAPPSSLTQHAPPAKAAKLPAPSAPPTTGKVPGQEAKFISHPPPVPLAESENTDIMAVRANISLLQLQREKARSDIKALENIKKQAIAEPNVFMRELLEGKVKGGGKALGAGSDGGLLAPTLGNAMEGYVSKAKRDMDSGGNDKGSTNDTESPLPPDAQTVPEQMETTGDSDSDSDESAPGEKSRFPPIPGPQNVFRLPPINWDKYRVVGEPLEKLAQEARERPLAVASPHDAATVAPGNGLDMMGRPPKHSMAAPYSPWDDKDASQHVMQTRRKGSARPG